MRLAEGNWLTVPATGFAGLTSRWDPDQAGDCCGRWRVGLKGAMGMILTGRGVGSNEGKELGFIDDVVPAAELMTAARRWAETILACSPTSIRASKQVVTKGLKSTLPSACQAQAKISGSRRDAAPRGPG